MSTEQFFSIYDLLGILFGIFALVISISHLIYTRIHDKKSISISGFDTIQQILGPREIVLGRNEIYRKHEDIQKLIEGFERFDYNENLKKFHDDVWYMYTVYNRIGFILKQDPKLRIEYLKFHGDTMAKLFIILHGLIEKWNEKQGSMNYPYLKEFVINFWNKNSPHYDGERRNRVLTSIKNSYISIYSSNGDKISFDELEKKIF